MINGKTLKEGKLSMTRNEFKKLNLTITNGKVTELKFKIPGKPTQLIKTNTIDFKSVKHINEIKKDDHLVIFDIKDRSEIEIEP